MATEKIETRKRSSDAEVAGALMKLRLFAGMPRETVVSFLRLVGGRVRHFAKGETVVYEGTRARWVMPVLNGCLQVYESAANGERHFARVVEEGQLLGGTLVTLNLEYYPGMAVAMKASTVVFFEIDRIRRLWMDLRYRRFFENLYSIVSGYVLDCWRKLSILSCKKAEDRFMLYLRWYSAEVGSVDVILPFSAMEPCAEYLGLTRTGLSLAIKRLVKSGAIEHPGKAHFVLKREESRESAGRGRFG